MRRAVMLVSVLGAACASEDPPDDSMQSGSEPPVEESPGGDNQNTNDNPTPTPFGPPQTVMIPAGQFTQGSASGDDDELPLRQVTLSTGFEMSTTEVTVRQYAMMLNWALDPNSDGDRSDALVAVDQAATPNLVRNVTADPGSGEGWEEQILYVLDSVFSDVTWDGSRFGILDVPGHPDGDTESLADHPVEETTWFGALFYSWALNRAAGGANPISLVDWTTDSAVAGWRLPTEAEWEYAARGGFDGADFPWWTADPATQTAHDGSQANGRADGDAYDNSPRGKDSAPVGTYAPNAFGLYDMAGNGREWVADWYGEVAYDGRVLNAVGEATVDPQGPPRGMWRVVRGGDYETPGQFLTTASRSFGIPALGIPLAGSGFRSVRSAGVPNSPPRFTSPASFTVPEGQTVAGVIAVDDDDTNAELTLSVAGGPDRDRLTIDANPTGGVLRFSSIPEAETQSTFSVTLEVSDGRSSTTQDLVITVESVDDGFTPELLPLASGRFMQGDATGTELADALPRREVELTEQFQMGATEVTARQFVNMLNWALDPNGDGNQEDSYIEVQDAGSGEPDSVAIRSTDPRDPSIAWEQQSLLSMAMGSYASGMGTTSVSNGAVEWLEDRFQIRDDPGHPDGAIDSRADHPVTLVSWYGAQFYCWALNELNGIGNPIDLRDWSVDQSVTGYRLPTEAEWEYAARGGLSEARYSWWTSDVASQVSYDGSQANGRENGDVYEPGTEWIETSPVKSYAPNALGLYDIAGNVSEWTSDWYDADAYDGPTQDGVGDFATDPFVSEAFSMNAERVVRGGGWFGGTAEELRTAARDSLTPRAFGIEIGFRVAFATGVAVVAPEFSWWSPESVDIPAGSFTQGSPVVAPPAEESPQRSVTLTTGYAMARQETTVADFVDMLNWATDPNGDGNTSDGMLTIVYPDPANLKNFAETAVWLNRSGVDEQKLATLHDPLLPRPSDPSQIVWDPILAEFVVRDVDPHPTGPTASRALHPVHDVTWHGAVFFCWAMNERRGSGSNPIDLASWSIDTTVPGWRLPTEAEWERAALGDYSPDLRPATDNYSWVTDDSSTWTGAFGDYANYWQSGDSYDGSGVSDRPYTTPSGYYAPGNFGLYDMSGNVYEWCADYYDADAYGSGSSVTDPAGPASGSARSIRGGSWFTDDTDELRTSHRRSLSPTGTSNLLGFRPVTQ
ncbi:MAG: SUMF1/EgtB/PvdO family nonheme iron enzyme [Myxococcota bacterium]